MLLSAYACFAVTGDHRGGAGGLRQDGSDRGPGSVRGFRLGGGGDAAGADPGSLSRPGARAARRGCCMKAGWSGCSDSRKPSSPRRRTRWIINLGSKFRKPGSIAFWKRRWAGWCWRNLACWFFPPALSSSTRGTRRCWSALASPLGENGVIGPGLHFKLPWPIDRTTVYHTERIQTFHRRRRTGDKAETIAWAVTHAKEENFLVASRESNAEALQPIAIGRRQKPAGQPAVREHPGAISDHQSGDLGLHQQRPGSAAQEHRRTRRGALSGERGLGRLDGAGRAAAARGVAQTTSRSKPTR